MNCVRTRGEEPPRLYGVINGLLRMRNGLRRSQELDDLVDVLASSIGALTNPRTNCPHRRRSRRRSLAARDRRQLPEDRPRTRRGQTRPRRARHPHDERLRFPPRPGQPDDVTPWIGYNVLDSPMRDEWHEIGGRRWPTRNIPATTTRRSNGRSCSCTRAASHPGRSAVVARHPQDHRAGLLQRQARGVRQQDQGHHPHGLRLPPREQPHRTRHAPLRRQSWRKRQSRHAVIDIPPFNGIVITCALLKRMDRARSSAG